MASRIFALLTWAAVAASVAYWGLRWLAAPATVPPHAGQVALEGTAQGDLHRLLGAGTAVAAPTQAALPELASRVRLIGVVAPKTSQDNAHGVALLSIDGKPPRAIRVGEPLAGLEGDVVLKSLNQRGAEIGPANGPATQLDLPALPAPNSGNLPAPAQIDRNAQGTRVSIDGPGARPATNTPPAAQTSGQPPAQSSDDGNMPPPAAGPGSK